MSRSQSADVVVIGAGAIGAAIAWRCARRGLSVVTVDPDPQRGAWHTAAGMLAPVTELQYTETPLLRLSLDSLRRYPDFLAELGAETARPTGHDTTGIVSIAWDGADLAALRDQHEFTLRLGLSSQLLTGRELRELEPGLAAGLPGGQLAADDHQIDPRLLHAALVAAGSTRGVRPVTATAGLTFAGGRVTGVTTDTGETISAGVTVLAAGAWSPLVEGLPPVAVPPVRPVKGQTMRLRLPAPPTLRHVVRGTVKGNPIYLVPRSDGELVVGGSSEEDGYALTARAGAVYELLRDAQSVLPEAGEAVLAEVSTGLRPGSPDNSPLLGGVGIDGLVLATGHHRNGILLTPVTADAIADLITTGALPPVAVPFTADRFAGRPPAEVSA